MNRPPDVILRLEVDVAGQVFGGKYTIEPELALNDDLRMIPRQVEEFLRSAGEYLERLAGADPPPKLDLSDTQRASLRTLAEALKPTPARLVEGGINVYLEMDPVPERRLGGHRTVPDTRYPRKSYVVIESLEGEGAYLARSRYELADTAVVVEKRRATDEDRARLRGPLRGGRQ